MCLFYIIVRVMKTDTNETYKPSFSKIVLSFLKGLLLGFFDCFPFFQTKRLEETLHKEKDDGLHHFFSRVLPYLLAMAIASSIYFFIPLDTMTEKYSTGIYAGMGGMILVFMIADVYQLLKDKEKNKIHIISSIATFIVVFAIFYAFSYIKFKEPSVEGIVPLILLLFFLVVGSFLSSFSGISSFSILIFFGYYSYMGNYINGYLYSGTKKYIVIFMILLIGYTIGKLVYLVFQNKLDNLKTEKRASSLAISLAGFIWVVTKKLKAPWYFESKDITILAQQITIFTTIFACLVVAFCLTYHVYPFGKKDKEEEKCD